MGKPAKWRDQYGSLLEAALANIFIEFQEARLLEIPNLPQLYDWYADDTFVFFYFWSERRRFFIQSPSVDIHEQNNSLPILDVLVERTEFGVQTLTYRKPTIIGSYTRWNSFCLSRRKINSIKALVQRTLMICSKPKIADELDFIKTICWRIDTSRM